MVWLKRCCRRAAPQQAVSRCRGVRGQSRVALSSSKACEIGHSSAPFECDYINFLGQHLSATSHMQIAHTTSLVRVCTLMLVGIKFTYCAMCGVGLLCCGIHLDRNRHKSSAQPPSRMNFSSHRPRYTLVMAVPQEDGCGSTPKSFH